MLKKRGTAISHENWQECQFINQKIQDYIQNPKGREEICQVISAFITFEASIGYDQAVLFIKQKQFYDESLPILLGSKMVMKEAANPRNIIWENKHLKGGTLIYRRV